jgi:hypothetical protein
MTVQDTGAPTAVSAASVDYELRREAIGAPASPISLTVVASGRRQQVSGDLDMDRTWTGGDRVSCSGPHTVGLYHLASPR